MDAKERYDSLFQFYAEQSGLTSTTVGGGWRLLKAQAIAESGLKPDVESPVGARGLSQFMAATWREWADGTPGVQEAPPSNLVLLDPRDPEDAIRAQAGYMAWLLRLLAGDVRAALGAYNWGIGRVKRGLQEHGENWLEHAPDETRQYVPRILRILGDLIAQDPTARRPSGGDGNDTETHAPTL